MSAVLKDQPRFSAMRADDIDDVLVAFPPPAVIRSRVP